MYSHERPLFHIWSSFASSSVYGTLLFFGSNGTGGASDEPPPHTLSQPLGENGGGEVNVGSRSQLATPSPSLC